ncbi:hypothetical protein H8E07_11940 [bacterium]|nr:hypothetical protein [bacterium]
MPRFPKARRKNKTVSVFEQAHRFYGQAFEVTSTRELADSMAEWGDLAPPERTFTLTHLLYLNLMAQAGTHLLLRKVWETVEDLADEMEDQADRGGDDDGEDDGEEEGDDDGDSDGDGQEVNDLEEDEDDDAEAVLKPASPLEHAAPSARPPGVTIPVAVTPPVDDDEEDDDLDEGNEG